MAIIDNITQATFDITLTQADPEQILSLENEAGTNSIQGSVREFCVSGTFGGATIKVQRFMSDHIGYVDILDVGTGSPYQVSSSGAGYGLAFYIRKGAIKFILDGATGSTNLKISIFK